MARTLAAGGEDISALVLVDPRLPRPSGLRYDLWVGRRRLRAGNSLRSFRGWVGRRGAPRDPGEFAATGIEAGIARAREAHRQRPYIGPAVLILSEEHEQYEIPRWHLAWAIPNARTVQLALGHTPMLRMPGVQQLAGAVRDALVRDGADPK
jgi:hypothetical protein